MTNPQQKFSVVHVIDQLLVGGTERVLVTLANVFQNNGHTVTVVTTVSPGPLANALHINIQQVCLNRKWKWNPVILYRLHKVVRQYDIIHVHSRYNLRYLFLSMRLFGLKKTIFYQEHSGHIQPGETINLIDRLMIKQTVFIAVSKQLADWAIAKINMPVNKVYVLPNTIERRNILPSLNGDNGIKKIILVSNFYPNKNIGFAIQLINELVSSGSTQLHLTVVGQAFDSGYYQSITALIEQLKLQAYISILTNCSNVQNLLPAFDLALHTAVNESGPLVLLEYMAQGLPFITHDTGEVAALIKPSAPEFVIAGFDKNSWLEKIDYLLNNDTAALKERLLLLYETHFSTERYYEQCLHIYLSERGSG